MQPANSVAACSASWAQELAVDSGRRGKEGGARQQQERRGERSAAVDALVAEGDDEGQQIEAERHDPQERHHRRPLRDRRWWWRAAGPSPSADKPIHARSGSPAAAAAGEPRAHRLSPRPLARRSVISPQHGEQRRIEHVGPRPPARLLLRSTAGARRRTDRTAGRRRSRGWRRRRTAPGRAKARCAPASATAAAWWWRAPRRAGRRTAASSATMRQVGSLASCGFQLSEGVIGSSSRLSARMASWICACRGTGNGSVTA